MGIKKQKKSPLKGLFTCYITINYLITVPLVTVIAWPWLAKKVVT